MASPHMYRFSLNLTGVRWTVAALFAAAGLASSTPNARAAVALADSAHGIHITTLSARPYLISGGDVLVRVDVPQKVKISDTRVTLNGTDITS